MSVPKRISRIRFGLISPQEFRKMSVVKIITADTYDDDGFPIEMGLMDPRLGVIDPGLRCRSCGGRPGECPGHFGHIDLIAPVIHVGFAKLIRKILRAVCRSCSRLMISADDKTEYLRRIQELERLGQITEKVVNEVFTEARKHKTCPYCSAPQQEIKFERPLSYIEDGHKLTASDIRDRFEKIPDEDIKVMGMNPETARPEWMILTVLPVPPVTMRPSITLESGQRSEDDLTHKLVDIIRINQRFQENREAGAPQLIIEDLWELLQYHVTTFLDNTVSGVPPARHRSGRPLKTLSQRLKGKEGRFRGSLSGKRVNFSARTVISPDPNLSINDVGVPKDVAMELSVPIVVNSRNKDIVKTFVERGPERHPGVNYVTRADGRRVKVTDKNCAEVAEQIDSGWRIDRQLADGDIVLFNRQPSLHRMSIMAHRVKVMPYKTFRLNPAVCPPYNADFDGDEMNLHVPQTEEARAEAEILMRVQENILSPRFGGPIIGGIHDYVTGSFLLTHGSKPIDSKGVMELLKKFDLPDLPEPAGHADGEPYWTGKQVFSTILPRGLNLTFRADFCYNCEVCRKEECEHDAFVVIRDGQLLQGTIDAEAVGAFKGKITDRVIKEFSPSVASEFLDRMTLLALRGIMYAGFSFGIDDEAYKAGELEPLPGRTLDETLEMRIMQTLGKARDTAGKIASRYLGLDNSGVVMAVSGARGSMLNLTQMAACVGQQSVRGERIKRGYASRTLPHFQKGDLGAEAHGFVESSYKDGLTPTEFFFHAIGGREGLVDTAIRTSQSGYLQRRLVNALQDLEVRYDGTVQETRGMIVQFQYGEDGVDASRRDYASPDNVKRIISRVLQREKA
jgi:DNA-directed RNA polymerase subunit A'